MSKQLDQKPLSLKTVLLHQATMLFGAGKSERTINEAKVPGIKMELCGELIYLYIPSKNGKTVTNVMHMTAAANTEVA